MKFVLKHPLQFGETSITELKLREHALASDYLAFDKSGGVAQNMALIASMSGTDEALIAKLHASDYLRAVKVCEGHIESAWSEANPVPDVGAAKDAGEKK